MSVKINSVTNANIYLNGESFLGRAAEVTLPAVKWKTNDHQGLGMIGAVKIPAGGLEPMEAKIKWASYYPEAMKANADPRRGMQLQVRASIEQYGPTGLMGEQSLIFTIGGYSTEQSFGSIKAQDSAQPESTLPVFYYKVEANKELIMEVDLMANIFRAGEQDMLARFRNLLGA